MEDKLREAAQAVSSAEGENVYEQLLGALAQILGVEYALVSVYAQPDRRTLRTLATLVGGRIARNVEYPIAGTPCEGVMGRAFGIFPSGVRERFPHDAMLRERGIEGYAASTLTDAQGGPIGLLAVMSRAPLRDAPQVEAIVKIFATRVATEIERRRAEEVLRASGEQYRAIFNAATDALVLRDAEFRIVDVNPAFEALSGHRRAEVLGSVALTMRVPELNADRLEVHRRALGGEVVHLESEAVRKDGTRFHLEVHAVPMAYGGQPHVLYVGRDITGRKQHEARLNASEQQYRAIFDSTADALVLRDAEYRVVDVNPAFLKATGLRREDLVGMDNLIVIPRAQRDRLFELHRRAIAGEPIQFEAPAAGPDGRQVEVEVRGVPMMHQGRPHVLYIGRDITARKAQEARLRASEEQYRAIFDSAADALVLRDADFRIVDVNKAYVAMSGNAREEVIGQARLTFQLPEAQRQILELHARALAGEPVLFEAPAARRDGRVLQLELRGVPMLHEGRPHVLYVGRDITERKAAEERLRASEEQYREIFNATDEAVVLRDADFRIVDVNHAYEKMSGYTRAEVLHSDGLTFSSQQNREQRIALHRRALAGERVTFEVSGRSKGGREFTVDVRLVPIQYRGQPHVLQIGQEVTDRRRAEAERAELEAQLRQAQKMEAIGQLTGGIAHDFNNILQGILGNLALASERQAELGDARLGKYLERARHSAQRARELIGQMLTFSRGQRGERRPVALHELVRDAAKLLRSTLPSTIDLRLQLDDAGPPLEIDPVQVEQVVLNLCINARDAMRGAGAIRLGLKSAARIQGVCASCRQKVDGRYVDLSVRDNGPGIAPEVMDRMFEPFFSTKDVGRGSGMGLSLAHGIVHEHGGHILVDSLLGDRTKFRVLLPAPQAAVHDAQPAGPVAGAPAPARARLAGRVLVVDDEQAIREFMAELLAGWGLEVAALADGASARAAFAADPQRFDLVITDHTMPELTGLELARELSRLRPGLPLILYTGYAEALSAEELRAAGVLELVRKPIEPAQFFPLLAAHLPAR